MLVAVVAELQARRRRSVVLPLRAWLRAWVLVAGRAAGEVARRRRSVLLVSVVVSPLPLRRPQPPQAVGRAGSTAARPRPPWTSWGSRRMSVISAASSSAPVTRLAIPTLGCPQQKTSVNPSRAVVRVRYRQP